MEALYHIIAIAIAAYLVHWILDCFAWPGWRRMWCWASAWGTLAGGGAYGLLLHDSPLAVAFSWWGVLSVIGGTVAATLAVQRHRREKRRVKLWR